jgi:predicted Zn-dependent protease
MAWYHLATAFERKGDEGRAQLATAERYYAIGAKKQAVQFATRSLGKLKEGTTDWQRARDILTTGKDDAEEEERREKAPAPRPRGLTPDRASISVF